MRTAIRKHLPDFLAIIGLLIIAAVVSSVILSKQRLALPAWVPIVGKEFFEIEAEMTTAQAVTPGQGQTVNVAGVEVGEISQVRLEQGKAIVTLKLEEDSVPAGLSEDALDGVGKIALAVQDGNRHRYLRVAAHSSPKPGETVPGRWKRKP